MYAILKKPLTFESLQVKEESLLLPEGYSSLVLPTIKEDEYRLFTHSPLDKTYDLIVQKKDITLDYRKPFCNDISHRSLIDEGWEFLPGKKLEFIYLYFSPVQTLQLVTDGIVQELMDIRSTAKGEELYKGTGLTERKLKRFIKPVNDIYEGDFDI